MRENADPDLPSPFDVSGHGNTSRFDLSIGYPLRFSGGETEITERYFVTPVRRSLQTAPLGFSVFCPFRH
jgi:hypothetical protein